MGVRGDEEGKSEKEGMKETGGRGDGILAARKKRKAELCQDLRGCSLWQDVGRKKG